MLLLINVFTCFFVDSLGWIGLNRELNFVFSMCLPTMLNYNLNQNVRLSVCLSLSVSPRTPLSFCICLSSRLPRFLCLPASLCLFVCLFVLSTYIPIYLSVNLSLYLCPQFASAFPITRSNSYQPGFHWNTIFSKLERKWVTMYRVF